MATRSMFPTRNQWAPVFGGRTEQAQRRDSSDLKTPLAFSTRQSNPQMRGSNSSFVVGSDLPTIQRQGGQPSACGPISLLPVEQDSDGPFNNIEMSQLTMSTGLDNDASSIRSHPSRSVAPMNPTFPPLHQSSASTNSSCYCESNQASCGSNGIDGSVGAAMMPTTRNSNDSYEGRAKQPAMLACRTSQNPFGVPHARVGASGSTSPQGSRMMTQFDPSGALLRMNPQYKYKSKARSGHSLMRFRQTSFKQRLFPINDPYKTIFSPQGSDKNGNGKSSQSVSTDSKGSTAHTPVASANDGLTKTSIELDKQLAESMSHLHAKFEESLDKRLAIATAASEARVGERIKAAVEEEIQKAVSSREAQDCDNVKELEAKLTSVDLKLAEVSRAADDATNREVRITGLMQRMEAKETEIHAKLSRDLAASTSAIEQATQSSLKRLSNAADEAILRIGETVERTTASIVTKSRGLIDATIPKMRGPVKCMVESILASMTDGPKKRTKTMKAERRLSSLSEVLATSGISQSFNKFGGGSFDSQAELSADGPVLEVPSHDVGSTGQPARCHERPISSRLRKRSKRQQKNHSDKENKTPRSHKLRSCVTPTVGTSHGFLSPVPTSSLARTKASSEKPSSDHGSKRRIPLEVVVTTSNAGSPSSGLDEDLYSSPTRAKKRSRSLKPRGGRAKRSQVYRAKSRSALGFEDDPFNFL